MHPIERLRFVARAEGVPGEVLAAEAAGALLTFADDPAALTAACRRVLSRQAAVGPLWWVCAHLLTADDVRKAGARCIEQLRTDTTAAEASISADMADPEDPPIRLVWAAAFGSGAAFVPAEEAEVPDRSAAWLVGGVGRHLPQSLFESARRHLGRESGPGHVAVDLDRFEVVFGPTGPLPPGALGAPDCPAPPELMRLVG